MAGGFAPEAWAEFWPTRREACVAAAVAMPLAEAVRCLIVRQDALPG